MSEVSISLSAMAATASSAARSSVVSFLVFAIFICLSLLSRRLSVADDSARRIVVNSGPCVDDVRQ
jgi:hypothetical protein